MSCITVELEDIMKPATGLVKECSRILYKPCHSVSFGTLELAAKSSKSHVDMETEVYFSNGLGHVMATCYS